MKSIFLGLSLYKLVYFFLFFVGAPNQTKEKIDHQGGKCKLYKNPSHRCQSQVIVQICILNYTNRER